MPQTFSEIYPQKSINLPVSLRSSGVDMAYEINHRYNMNPIQQIEAQIVIEGEKTLDILKQQISKLSPNEFGKYPVSKEALELVLLKYNYALDIVRRSTPIKSAMIAHGTGSDIGHDAENNSSLYRVW